MLSYHLFFPDIFLISEKRMKDNINNVYNNINVVIITFLLNGEIIQIDEAGMRHRI